MKCEEPKVRNTVQCLARLHFIQQPPENKATGNECDPSCHVNLMPAKSIIWAYSRGVSRACIAACRC